MDAFTCLTYLLAGWLVGVILYWVLAFAPPEHWLVYATIKAAVFVVIAGMAVFVAVMHA